MIAINHAAVRMLLIACLLLVLTGCENGPAAQQQQEYPTLRDIASRVEPQLPPQPAGDQVTATTRRAAAYVYDVLLPLNMPSDEAWAQIDPERIPDLTRRVWQTNGLQLGVMPQGDLNLFVRDLPRLIRVREILVAAASHPSVLCRSARLDQPVTMHLPHAQADQPAETQQAAGGWLQLLANMGESNQLIITPHHFLPQRTLRPRDPLEQQLDGTMYDPLRIRVDMVPRQVIIIGLHRPWSDPPAATQNQPAPPATPNSTSAATDRNPSAEPTTSASPRQILEAQTTAQPPQPLQLPPLPRHLGQATMTGRYREQPFQRLIIISLQPLPNQLWLNQYAVDETQ